MFEQLIMDCAPNVHPQTMMAVMKAESAKNPYAMNVITDGKKSVTWIHDKQEAIIYLKARLAEGHDVATGLMQINSVNFEWLGLSADTIFDPCTNIAASATILQMEYMNALGMTDDTQAALDIALAAYNAGAAAVKKYNGIPPYKETINYIGAIREYAGQENGAANAAQGNNEGEARTASTKVSLSHYHSLTQ